jgi:phenylpropionate dioxygenase-like ring-hydroxylating dioxygenase large terminal subunit
MVGVMTTLEASEKIPALRGAKQREYTDPEIFEQELARVFDQDWVMVGRHNSIPEPGNYMTASVGKRPVVCIRQKDGSIRAFANFCLHRYAKLLEGRGKARRIVCPYHAWTYEITGQLIGITDPKGFGDPCKSEMGLRELACEVWLGFVFVALRRDLPSMASKLAPLARHLENYDLAAYDDRYVFDEEIWAGNWKLVYENFVECYHVTYAHKQSIGPTNPTRLAELGPRGERQFSIHYNPYQPEDLPEVHNEALDEDERRRLLVIGIYPNALIAIDANFVWWMVLEPQAVERTNGRWGLSFTPHAMTRMKDPAGFAEKIREVIHTATIEDKHVVAAVQQGVQFGAAEPGFLHGTLEIYVDEFRQYLDRMLGRVQASNMKSNHGE